MTEYISPRLNRRLEDYDSVLGLVDYNKYHDWLDKLPSQSYAHLEEMFYSLFVQLDTADPYYRARIYSIFKLNVCLYEHSYCIYELFEEFFYSSELEKVLEKDVRKKIKDNFIEIFGINSRILERSGRIYCEDLAKRQLKFISNVRYDSEKVEKLAINSFNELSESDKLTVLKTILNNFDKYIQSLGSNFFSNMSIDHFTCILNWLGKRNLNKNLWKVVYDYINKNNFMAASLFIHSKTIENNNNLKLSHKCILYLATNDTCKYTLDERCPFNFGEYLSLAYLYTSKNRIDELIEMLSD